MPDREEPKTKANISRRNFLRTLAAGAAGATVAAVGPPAPTAEAAVVAGRPHAGVSAGVTSGDKLSALERMRDDLARALQKAPEERKWIMVIDLRKCVGCHGCTVSCMAENHLPPGVIYRPVTEEEMGTYPNVLWQFLPRTCNQCDNPPCVEVCPVDATYKDENGIVTIEYETCIGCKLCIPACPYGARSFDEGQLYVGDAPDAEGLIVGASASDDYERAPSFEYGQEWDRNDLEAAPVAKARKCHFCLHRLTEGMLPACATTCIGMATYFGDANDTESLVSELLETAQNVTRLKEDLSTEPRVYYLT